MPTIRAFPEDNILHMRMNGFIADPTAVEGLRAQLKREIAQFQRSDWHVIVDFTDAPIQPQEMVGQLRQIAENRVTSGKVVLIVPSPIARLQVRRIMQGDNKIVSTMAEAETWLAQHGG